MNIALIGMMGVGKTTLGKELAKTLDFQFIDTDEEITRMHGEISQIFALKGEKYFRELETQAVKKLSQKDGLVIATGGGLPLAAENRVALKENGIVVYLKATAQTIESRLREDSTRPLLQGESLSLREKIDGLLAIRSGIYQQLADFVVAVDGKSIERLLKELIEKIQGAGTD